LVSFLSTGQTIMDNEPSSLQIVYFHY